MAGGVRSHLVRSEWLLMTTALDVLQEIRDLLAEPSRWTQGCAARTASALMGLVALPVALRWCIGGALFRATRGQLAYEHDTARILLLRAIGRVETFEAPFSRWNDSKKRLFDKGD